MIDGVDRKLEAWVQTVLEEGVDVSFLPPSPGQGDPQVHLYLTDVLNRPATGEARRIPHRILLRYLVTVSAEDPTRAHSILGNLVFAALEQPDFEVEIEALPIEVWSTFGVPPQPAFVLRLPLTNPKAERPVKPVRKELELRPSPMIDLMGLVFGPEDVPIAGARVELPSVHRHTRTDNGGRFRFSGIPADPRPRRLLVSAKGRREVFSWDEDQPLDEPLIIHLELEA
jgi:hypothetical protein